MTIVKQFLQDRRGGIALIAAFAFPLLVLIVVAAVELQSLAADRQKLQDVADATALNAASQMRLAANEPVLERARSLALAGLTDLQAEPDAPDVKFLLEGGKPSGIVVSLTARRLSFFGNLLPPGGFVLTVTSTAVKMGEAPLCVLAVGGSTNALDLPSAQIIARSCLVHSNRSIALGGTTSVEAAALQAVESINGGTPPNSGTGAAVVDNPLSTMFTGAGPGACNFTSGVQVQSVGETKEVSPGVHCRHFDVENGTLKFLPGVHHLKSGELQLKRGAKVEGDNVTLVIWKDLILTFSNGKVDRLRLSGSQGGTGQMAKWAGFVLAVDPARSGDVILNFNEIRRLEGVVYAPNTRVVVPGGINATEVTPWTVVVARDFRVEGGRSLLINADYANSSVPVPVGVGNKSEGSRHLRLID